MTAVVNSYIAEAERLAADRARSDPAWLTRVRRDALERFDRLGFPTTRDEEWRFTSVAPIATEGFVLGHNGASGVTASDLLPFEWPGHTATMLVFVNGRSLPAGSSPRGAQVLALTRAVSEGVPELESHLTRVAAAARHAFTALNTAFLADGAFIHVPDNTVVEAPIHLLFLSVGEGAKTMAHPRVLVAVGKNSQATVVESYRALGADRYFTNAVTEIAAGNNATVHHYKVQDESPAAFHVGGMYLRAARDATLSCHSIALGGALVRNEVNVVLDGEGCVCTLNGVYLSDRARLVDNHTTIDHAKPHCASREVYKGILADRARAVFNGKIIVRPDAQKTDAKQTSKALLLSEDAQINTKPQLEIFANDVKCTHGAAVGQMDDEAIFYLRARGLDERQARRMLVRAFAGDILNRVRIAPLRERIEEALVAQLPRVT